jgi:hypothetical protein
MTHIARTLGKVLGLAALITMLAACGGGSDSTAGGGTVNPPGGGGSPPIIPPEVIEGVATPSSVSVVTATNAN